MRINLVKLRNEKELSVKDLAEVLGISESFYYKIESGTRNPNFNLTKKISDFFGADVAEIFFNDKMDTSSNENYTA